MFLLYCFNSFNFVIATIFSKSSAILLIALLFTLFAAFFLCNFDMCKCILPRILKRSKLGSLGLHQKNLKLCFLNMSSLSFPSSELQFSWFSSSTLIVRLSFLNQISEFLIIFIFSAIDVSSSTIMLSWLYPNFFLNSVASGNLQRSIISRASFSILKTSSSPSKYALFFFFFFCSAFCFFAAVSSRSL